MAQIYSFQSLEALILKMGFLPFFKNEIPDFSVEEFTPPEFWFSDECDGPWEWKGPVVRNGNCAYGKLFRGKAGFVSLEWFPELMNYRRASYCPTDDSVREKEKLVYRTVVEYESLLSKEVKTLCGFKKPPRKNFNPFDLLPEQGKKSKNEGFETILTRLQMTTYLVVADFEYQYDKRGETYGWGIARYTTPEALFGEDFTSDCKGHSPQESKERIIRYLSDLLPQATNEQIHRIIG